MSRVFSYLAMICGLVASVLFAVLAAVYPLGNMHLYLCIAVTCMEFIFVRFNLVALRTDQTERLLVVNHGAILIMCASIAYFIRVVIGSFPIWLDITLASLGAIYAVFIIIFYVIAAKQRKRRL